MIDACNLLLTACPQMSYSWNLDLPTPFANAEALDPAVPEAGPIPLDFPVTEVKKFPLGLPDILSWVCHTYSQESPDL